MLSALLLTLGSLLLWQRIFAVGVVADFGQSSFLVIIVGNLQQPSLQVAWVLKVRYIQIQFTPKDSATKH